MIIQFLLAMTATASFAVLFNAPKKQLIFNAATGALGWISYLVFCAIGFQTAAASLAAAFSLTIISRIFATIFKCPATLYLVTGIFTLVPGAGIYYTSYYFIMNEMELFAEKGIETFQIAGAIAVGILFGFSIPEKLFHS